MNEVTKRLHVYAAIGMLEMVRDLEEKEKAKSARSISLRNLIDYSVKVGDFYDINSLREEDPAINLLLDQFYGMIQRRFCPKQVGRDAKGRWCRV